MAGNISGKEWNDTIDDLNRKKNEVNCLEERVLELELKADKLAIDTKIKIQEKDDEISEEKLKFRHKESDLRQAHSHTERLNEDI